MFIRVEPGSGVPITRQIADQIRMQCATGALLVGQRLPSIRALARELAVNQNTILRVYERLTAEGLVERRHGDGTYVNPRPPAGQLRTQRRLLRQEVDRVVARATVLGLDAAAFHSLVDESFERVERSSAEPEG